MMCMGMAHLRRVTPTVYPVVAASTVLWRRPSQGPAVSDSHVDLAYFRRRLEALCAELRRQEEAGAGAASTVELDQQRVGRLSRMDALGAQAMARASRERRAEALQRARAALQRIDSGHYGICVRCDEEIDPRRLESDPAATMCIHCAERSER